MFALTRREAAEAACGSYHRIIIVGYVGLAFALVITGPASINGLLESSRSIAARFVLFPFDCAALSARWQRSCVFNSYGTEGKLDHSDYGGRRPQHVVARSRPIHLVLGHCAGLRNAVAAGDQTPWLAGSGRGGSTWCDWAACLRVIIFFLGKAAFHLLASTRQDSRSA